jgi:hypothetical protein
MLSTIDKHGYNCKLLLVCDDSLRELVEIELANIPYKSSKL